jgi:hypothetical protein
MPLIWNSETQKEIKFPDFASYGFLNFTTGSALIRDGFAAEAAPAAACYLVRICRQTKTEFFLIS